MMEICKYEKDLAYKGVIILICLLTIVTSIVEWPAKTGLQITLSTFKTKTYFIITKNNTCKATFLPSSGTGNPSCSIYLVSVIISPRSGSKSTRYLITMWFPAAKQKIIHYLHTIYRYTYPYNDHGIVQTCCKNSYFLHALDIITIFKNSFILYYRDIIFTNTNSPA